MVLTIRNMDIFNQISNGFWQNDIHLSGFQMVGLLEFRSDLRSRPFANHLCDHSKYRQVQISDPHNKLKKYNFIVVTSMSPKARLWLLESSSSGLILVLRLEINLARISAILSVVKFSDKSLKYKFITINLFTRPQKISYDELQKKFARLYPFKLWQIIWSEKVLGIWPYF